MMPPWINFFSEIFLINLPKRTDRLLTSAEQFERFEIPFTRISAIENEKGAIGLRDTMQNLFEDCIAKKKENVLIFEDDFDIVVSPIEFHDAMNKVTEQIPDNYWMCFLGCQITGAISHFKAPNIIAAQKMFSTHAVFYSLDGMKNILAMGFDYPIDNFYVDKIEPMARSYCTYPFLVSQKAGYSDIGGAEMNWKAFLEHRFEQKISELKR